MAFRNYSVSNGFVVAKDNTGDFTTIQAGITAASSGQTVIIRDGTYTENLTLKAGVDITAMGGDAFEPNVTIIGKCTLTTAGTVTISNIKLQTNSDFFLAVTGSAASIVNLIQCNLSASNNGGISFTSSSTSAQINITDCQGDQGTTGISFFAHSSNGSLTFQKSTIGNSGSNLTASTASAGFLNFNDCPSITIDMTVSGTGCTLSAYRCNFGSSQNTTSITYTSTSGQNARIVCCNFITGSASALSIGSASLEMIFCNVESSNTNAITGAGTLLNGGITFSGTSTKINTTTQTAFGTNMGAISFDGGVTYLNSYLLGTFTPGISFGGSTTGIAYVTQTGYYTRVGAQVFVDITIVLSNKGSATGAALVTGLPITTGAHAATGVTIIGNTNITNTASYTFCYAQPNNSATTLALGQMGSGQAAVALTDTNFANNTVIYIKMSYTLQ